MKGLAFLLCATFFGSAQATTIALNLNDFFADPSIIVTPDGSSAAMSEDPNLFSVLLVNDPFLGDPEIVMAGANTSLLFNYVFDEPAGNDDEFIAFVLDTNTGLSAGAEFEFLTSASSSGTVGFDLSSLTGTTLGIQFELASFDAQFTSTITISNLRLNISDVPEPPVLALISLSLLMMQRKHKLQ